jgi:hypothetical protein
VTVRACPGLTALDLPAATWVWVESCPGVRRISAPQLLVPVVAGLHRQVYAAASAPGALAMRDWHTCRTTHCWAGWIVTLAGEEGQALEARTDCPTAATLIWCASTDAPLPDFYSDDATTLAAMRHLADTEEPRP